MYTMSDDRLIRLENLKSLELGPTDLKKKFGRSVSYWSDMLKGKKSFGEDVARDIEEKGGLPRYWLDQVNDKALPLKIESNTDQAPNLMTGVRVPVVGNVKGGHDGYLDELQYPVGAGEGFVEYWTPDKHAYALRVKGDSMHPRYRAGEFIVVTPSIEPMPGRDVVVKLKDGRKLLKQLNWIKGGEVQLLSINNGYAPMTVDLADVEGIERVGGSVPSDAFVNT